ncbi:hypothetical protein CANINC_002300 [Pichia inconspicua]|uniref:Anaphase-promoting complex subunit 4 WD40 domain-containing protein n=1 Tax=Pichia inconspicua TaxID=52247 RepID=A0A4V4NFR4_9ASCO|nr:hypothetical protein CANINC_002300 [[Candida] inconspicua]
MNLALHDPQFITADFPSALTMTLSYGHSAALQLSPCGHYIASGLVDGTILIIDTWTNNVTQVLKKHGMAITGLRWVYAENDSDDDNNTLVALVAWSRDWKVTLHGVRDNVLHCEWEHTFVGGVWAVDNVCRGSVSEDGVWIGWKLVVCRAVGGVCFVSADGKMDDVRGIADNEEGSGIERGQALCCWTFCDGKFVIVGTSKGWLQIVDVKRICVVKEDKICGSNVKGVCIVEKNEYFGNVPVQRLIVNASDRILRQYDINHWYDDVEQIDQWRFDIEHRYQNAVNRIQWNTVKFSPTGEYVCASTQGGSAASHDVYIWETTMGSLVQILEGAPEELIDVDWGMRSTNGNLCCVVANGMDSGTIYMWGVRTTQKWSALAPDFEEIEQNIDYVEMEDEFDINEENDLNPLGNGNDEDDEFKFEVDVVTKEETDARGFKFIKGCIIDTEL